MPIDPTFSLLMSIGTSSFSTRSVDCRWCGCRIQIDVFLWMNVFNCTRYFGVANASHSFVLSLLCSINFNTNVFGIQNAHALGLCELSLFFGWSAMHIAINCLAVDILLVAFVAAVETSIAPTENVLINSIRNYNLMKLFLERIERMPALISRLLSLLV